MDVPGELYLPTGDGFVATALTIGPWDAGFQHAGPPAALLLREAERAGAIEGGQTVRMAYDIFAPVPVGPVRVRASVVRPGRRIELVEAVLDAGDERPLMRLSAWRMRVRTDAPGGETPVPVAIPGPYDSRPEVADFFRTEVAYHRALDWRVAPGPVHPPPPPPAGGRPAGGPLAGGGSNPPPPPPVLT